MVRVDFSEKKSRSAPRDVIQNSPASTWRCSCFVYGSGPFVGICRRPVKSRRDVPRRTSLLLRRVCDAISVCTSAVTRELEAFSRKCSVRLCCFHDSIPSFCAGARSACGLAHFRTGRRGMTRPPQRNMFSKVYNI